MIMVGGVEGAFESKAEKQDVVFSAKDKVNGNDMSSSAN